jgi:spore coat protein U-like protein
MPSAFRVRPSRLSVLGAGADGLTWGFAISMSHRGAVAMPGGIRLCTPGQRSGIDWAGTLQMKMFSRSITAAALIAGFWCVSAYFSAARALNCTFTITNTAFGSVDVTANTVFDTIATLQVNCTAISGGNGARVCVSLGAGTGGATNAANHFMLSGANTLRYSLFTDAGRSIVWGSYVWVAAGASGVQIDFAGGGGGSQSATRTIFGRV